MKMFPGRSGNTRTDLARPDAPDFGWVIRCDCDRTWDRPDQEPAKHRHQSKPMGWMTQSGQVLTQYQDGEGYPVKEKKVGRSFGQHRECQKGRGRQPEPRPVGTLAPESHPKNQGYAGQ